MTKVLTRLVGPRVAEIAEMWGKSTGSSASQPGKLITEEAVSGLYLLVRHKPLISMDCQGPGLIAY